MMTQLLDKLKSDPPQTEEELEQLLGETGYDLVPTEPTSPEGEDMDAAGMGDMAEEEPPEGEEMVEEESMEEEADMPPPMKMPGKALTRIEFSMKRQNAAKRALDEDKKNKKKGGMYG